jgi:hypothetical protein
VLAQLKPGLLDVADDEALGLVAEVPHVPWKP